MIFYSLAVRLLLTAAGIHPTVNIRNIDIAGRSFVTGNPVEGKVSVGGTFSGLADIVVRTSLNEVVYSKKIPVSIKGEVGNFSFNLPGMDAGRYYLDVWLKRGGLLQHIFSGLKTAEWASVHFIVQEPEKLIESLSLAGLSFHRNGEVKAVVSFAHIPPEGVTLSSIIMDRFNRILVKKEGIVPRGKSVEISLPLNRTREIYHRLEVLLVQDGRVIDRKSEHFYVPKGYLP